MVHNDRANTRLGAVRYGKCRDQLRLFANKCNAELVSIIVTCFNNETYIAEAIESALAQTYSPCEVIVIDDGSTDGSLEVIRSFEPRIVWRTKENAGANAARNDGLALAQGEFIQFLDGDDVLLPDGVATKVEALDEHADAAFGDREWMDAAGMSKGFKEYQTCGWPPDDLEAYLAAATSIQTSEVLHRRGNLYRTGGFDEAFQKLQDTEFHLRLHLMGHRFKHVPKVVVKIRQHSSETRITNADWYSRNPFQIRDIALHFLGLPEAIAARPAGKGLHAVACRMIIGNSRRALGHGHLRRAWSLLAEAKEVCPDLPKTAYALDLGRRHAWPAHLIGFWNALRLACLTQFVFSWPHRRQ